MRRRSRYDHIRDDAVAAYVAGESSDAVGRRYGINGGTVLNWVKAAGISPRPRSCRRPQPHHRDESPDIYAGGWEPVDGILRPRVNHRQEKHA